MAGKKGDVAPVAAAAHQVGGLGQTGKRDRVEAQPNAGEGKGHAFLLANKPRSVCRRRLTTDDACCKARGQHLPRLDVQLQRQFTAGAGPSAPDGMHGRCMGDARRCTCHGAGPGFVRQPLAVRLDAISSKPHG